jgi:hypothetical protein
MRRDGPRARDNFENIDKDELCRLAKGLHALKKDAKNWDDLALKIDSNGERTVT